MTHYDRFLARDERALARAITLIENDVPVGQAFLKRLRGHTPHTARIIGITGSPGSGKSTLTDALIAAARAQDRHVAVVAVDPTSSFSGGAILGDRIRMTRWHHDSKVYIRSMASRGHLGGLAAATLQVVALIEAFGFDDIIIETVGVGQSEIDIAKVADTTLLVLTPGQGDGVQAFKAGIMEIADLFVINKFDLPGAPRLKREIMAALELGHPQSDWWPDVLGTTASTGEGVDDLWSGLDKHYTHLKQHDHLQAQRLSRARFEISSVLSEQLRLRLETLGDTLALDVLTGDATPLEAAQLLLKEQLGIAL